MTFTSTLAKLLRKDTEARTAAACDYAQLVRDAGADRSVTEAVITSTLAAAGKSLADLEADVQTERQRLVDIGTAGRRAELLGELQQLSQEEAAEAQAYAAEFADVQQRHQAAGAEFQARRALLNAQLDRATAAERSLTTGHPRLAEIRSEIGQLLQEERRCMMPFGGVRRRVPLGSQAADQLVCIDQSRERLTREAEELERELLTAN